MRTHEVVIAAVMLAACGGAPAATPTASPTGDATVTTPPSDAPTDAPTDVASTPPAVTGTIDWATRNATLVLPDGWEAPFCEGEAPVLCVHRDGEHVGVVEHAPFALSSMPAVQEAIASGTVLDGARALVDDYHASHGADREAGCPEGYQFAAEEPVEVEVAGQPGLRYGFVVIDAAGIPVERNTAYVTILGDQVHLITAVANEETSCVGAGELEFDVATLREFEPLLGEVVRVSLL